MYWNINRSKHNNSASANWLSLGGTANDGTSYGPPDSAIAWGKVGCPLVPRTYRARFGQQTAPPLLKRVLKAPDLTLSDLDSEFMSRSNMTEIPPQISDALSTLFYQLPVLSEVAIPAGIPVSWLTKLPLKGRLRNALSRFFWPHILVVKRPLRCAEFMVIPAVGKTSLHELLCVLESAELKKSQTENDSSPSVSEITARIRGGAQLEFTENRVTSDISAQEQDKTEHGEQPPPAPSTSRGSLGRVKKRELPERHIPEQDETADDSKGIKDDISPTIAEMTARILGQVQSEHAGNPVASPESVQEQDETEHGEQPPPARLTSRGTWGRVEKSVVPDRHVREQNQPEKDRIQAEDRVLPVKKDVYDKTDGSIFQEAVFESARQAIRAGLLQFDSPDRLPVVVDEENEVVCSVSALGDLLRHFVTWALAETDAQTIGEAITQSTLRTETSEEWQAIAELSLNQAGFRPEHPYTILESWVDNLPAREQHIFSTRVSGLEDIPTLQDLGVYFGLTRERVRQLEKRVRRKLTIMLKRESAKPVHWRAETIKQEIGVAAPFASVEGILSALNGRFDFRRIVLEIAGPYEILNGWLALRSALGSEPTQKIREMADEMGFIEPQLAAQALRDWGLDQTLNEEWLMRDGKVRMLNGRLVRWDGSIGDKLVIALADIGRPATIEALLEYVKEDRAKTSAANALSIDPRAVRIRGKEWALASWGLPEYSSIAMSIRNVLKSHEHPTSVEDVVMSLTKDLGLRESSIRAYCQAPMFIRESGTIRLRRDDEPYVYDNVSLQNAKGVFAPGPHRVSILFEVDAELLRGSGRPLALAAGFLLGVGLNRPLTFNDQDGLSVTLTYPETSISGPSVGSLRPFAEASGARLGDLLTLTLDESDKSVTAVATDPSQHESGWALISRLTGIGADEGLEGLASALHCGKGEVRAMLTKRGDEVVKDALPKGSVSSELDQALASLEAQLQQDGGSLR